MKRKFSLVFYKNSKISTRFLIISISLFAIVSALITITMIIILNNLANIVSEDYARLYSSNTAGTLNTYFGSQIVLVKKAANSNAVIKWFDDENNQEKKAAAYEEMMEIADSLPSKNLYIGIEKTYNEFTIEDNYTIDDIQAFATLDPNYFDDTWYFECASSDKDYLLNVDIDKILHRKRVWLNYKVSRDDIVYGVICTWLEFSELVEELFAEYDNNRVRGLVIDENGIIHMDSALLGNEDFLHYTIDSDRYLLDEFTDPSFISAANGYLNNINGFFDLQSDTTVIKMSENGLYKYATIAPIASTTWSVVTFYNASSLFGISNLLPLLISVFAMLIIFIVATSFTIKRLIFDPFEKVMRSIVHIKSNYNDHVYGVERNDEIGDIANTVQNMKDSLIDALGKVHYDGLTGIYNRRYLDENLSRIIKSLSRSEGMLSIIMIDIDYFKKYNDYYGHDMGDICLKTIAKTLASTIERADDFVARYGGEEFIIVLPNTDKNGACFIANKLLENIRDCNIPHEKSDVCDCVSISLGVTSGDVTRNQNEECYIKTADKALYISKNSNRNMYTFLELN